MTYSKRTFVASAFLLCLLSFGAIAWSQSDNLLVNWPSAEVPYVMLPEEASAFRDLRTDRDRETFIEQFWLRRDPTPGTVDNEFRNEYYARIVQANQKFTISAVPGWKTDRGRMWITHGEPQEITRSQGTLSRTVPSEGSRTSNLPLETWRYRFIQGIGNNIVIEFIDLNGDFRLVAEPR